MPPFDFDLAFSGGSHSGSLTDVSTYPNGWPGKTAFPDFVTPEARAWWGELNAAHVKSGLAGIWNDMNEPATGEIPPGAMRFDHGRAPHARYHNQ